MARSVVNEFETSVKLRLYDLLSREDSYEEANDVVWAIDELVAAYYAKLDLIEVGAVSTHCKVTVTTAYYKKPEANINYYKPAYEYEAPKAIYTPTYEAPTYEVPSSSYESPQKKRKAVFVEDELTGGITHNKTTDPLENSVKIDVVDTDYDTAIES